MTTYTQMHIPGAVLSATVGSVGGAIILYQAGRLLSPDRMEAVLSGRIGKVLRLKKENLQKASAWFDSKGNYTVFLPFHSHYPQSDLHSRRHGQHGPGTFSLDDCSWQFSLESGFDLRRCSRRFFLAKSSGVFRKLYPGGQNCPGSIPAGRRTGFTQKIHRSQVFQNIIYPQCTKDQTAFCALRVLNFYSCFLQSLISFSVVSQSDMICPSVNP